MQEHPKRPSKVEPRRVARRAGATVVGATVLAVGIAMLVLPGPGLVVIPLGVAILRRARGG